MGFVWKHGALFFLQHGARMEPMHQLGLVLERVIQRFFPLDHSLYCYWRRVPRHNSLYLGDKIPSGSVQQTPNDNQKGEEKIL